ncbi:MAG: hypothetical protein NVSMB65_14720 [Chloroflexota bacterium]
MAAVTAHPGTASGQAGRKAWTVFASAPDGRFGAVESWRDPARAQDLGVQWERLTFLWQDLQPHGPQDWNAFATGHDRPYDAELRSGRHLVGLLLRTPTWAAQDPTKGGGSPPRGLDLPWNDPRNYWGNFVYRIVKHYEGKVDDWIVWNEVTIPRGAFHTWDGTRAQYAQLVRVAYLAAHAANPHARVALYGEPYWYDRGAYFRAVLDLLRAFPDAAANHTFFDIAVLHLYSRPKDMALVVNWMRGELARRGMTRPIWINETNSVPRDDPLRPAPKANFNSTMDDQASFIVEAVAVDLAVGVERISINRMLDGPDVTHGGEPFGMVRNDGSLRPLYFAYKVATHLFAGVTSGTYLPNRATGVYTVVLNRPGLRITVAWNQRPRATTTTAAALGPTAYLITKLGDVTAVHPSRGRYTLALPGATDNSNPGDPADFVVGGSPAILAQPLR